MSASDPKMTPDDKPDDNTISSCKFENLTQRCVNPNVPDIDYLNTSINSDGNYEFLPDLYEGSQGGNYDIVNKNYKFNITRHVNEILAEKTLNDTIKIFPNGNGVTASRVVLNGRNSTKKDKAKIIISYSKY